jgi:hypothetical protein
VFIHPFNWVKTKPEGYFTLTEFILLILPFCTMMWLLGSAFTYAAFHFFQLVCMMIIILLFFLSFLSFCTSCPSFEWQFVSSCHPVTVLLLTHSSVLIFTFVFLMIVSQVFGLLNSLAYGAGTYFLYNEWRRSRQSAVTPAANYWLQWDRLPDLHEARNAWEHNQKS